MALPYPTRSIITASDLSTDAQVFPQLPGQDFMVARSPEWSTTILKAASGREIRSSIWSAPIYNFEVKHNLLRAKQSIPEVQKLMAFYNACLGSLGVFYYLDPEDYQVTDEPTGTGDGSTQTFQVMRMQAKGTVYQNPEPVHAFWQTPVFKVAGSEVDAWTMSTTGQVTFTSPPANGAAITWTGKFLYLCRFDQDKLDLDQIASLFWENQGLKFVSVKP